MSGRRRQPSYGMEALRGVLSGGHLRQLLGIRDSGRVFIAQVRNLLGGDVTEAQGADLFVHVIDVLSGLPVLARLHVPANILWRRPRADETCVVLQPADINSPGGPVAVYGDTGTADAPPPWLDDASGLYARETVRVESTDGNAVLEGGQVLLGPTATKGVNRQGDAVDCGTLAFTFTPSPGPSLSITYTPPGGAPVVLATGNGTLTLTGVTGPGSSKVKAED